MKKIKQNLSLFALCATVLSVCSCSIETSPFFWQMREIAVRAQYEAQTKTLLAGNGAVLWSPHDSISFFLNSGEKGGYLLVSTNQDAASTAVFNGKIGNSSTGTTFYAVYPYDLNTACSEGIITVTLPSVQTAVEGSFDKGLFISVASSTTDNMTFRHVCGGIMFSVETEGIRDVTFKNNDGNPIVGKLTVKMDSDGIPSVTDIAEGSSKVVVKAPDGGEFSPGKCYYAIMPPVHFSKGITIEYHRYGEAGSYKSNSEFSVKRATFSNISSKDSEVQFEKVAETFGKIPSNAIPYYIDRSTLTEINFYVNSSKVTNTAVHCAEGEPFRPVYFELDGTIANFYTSAECFAPESMYYMFANCTALTSLDLSNFDTSEVTDMSFLFQCCSSLKHINISALKTSSVTNMKCMFSQCDSLETIDLSSFNTESVTTMYSMFFHCPNLKSLDLTGFNTSRVTDMFQLFCGCESLTELDLSSFDVSKVTDMGSMFMNCSSLKSLDLSGFDTSSATNMSQMFAFCSNFNSLDLSTLNTSNVVKMNGMFSNCRNLTTLDLSNFNTANVTDISGMFQFSGLTFLDMSSLDVSKVKDARALFYGCRGLKEVDMHDLDFSSAIDIDAMFYSCGYLAQLDISGMKTPSVENFSFMFYGCSFLTSLDLSGFDTSNATTMNDMFFNCSSLRKLNLDSFDTSNVTDMALMFGECKSLASLDLSSFNTSSVTDMYGMFVGLSSVKTLDLSNFDTGNVMDMAFMFNNCYVMSRLDLSNFSILDSANCNNMCYNLARTSHSCIIQCSSATKERIRADDVRLVDDFIRWAVDGVDPEEVEELYESTDYSMDGKWIMLQKATTGKGINLFFIGDAFSDRLIADGTYDKRMNLGMEAFFADEPLKSLRDRFNVYQVYAVSRNESVFFGETALSTWFGEGTAVGGADGAAISYINPIGATDMDNNLICVIVNHSLYAGTAYMYYPGIEDYGVGLVVTYVPLCQNENEFEAVLRHEVAGHGFAKLSDEYFSDENGIIPDAVKHDKIKMGQCGWWKNVDYTPDLSEIKWSRFANDPRYSDQSIGAYLGGATYSSGVWRPTDYSNMRFNAGGFNAPSREAIYYRVHKLSEGSEWKYDYEEFVSFDLKTYNSSAVKSVYRPTIKHTHRPIVINDGWRDVLEKYKKKSDENTSISEPYKIRISESNKQEVVYEVY